MDFIFQNIVAFIKTFEKYKITTPLRIVHFLAQMCHESANFSKFYENLNYSAQRLIAVFPTYFTPSQAIAYANKPATIANRVYANRLGNGSEASADGYRYRGRGIIHLTGKKNYQDYKSYSGIDVVANPDLAARLDIALDIAGWYWASNKLNALADKDNSNAITQVINGGQNGAESRKAYLAFFKSQNLTFELLKKKEPLATLSPLPASQSESV